jgi:hypothetical protein
VKLRFSKEFWGWGCLNVGVGCYFMKGGKYYPGEFALRINLLPWEFTLAIEFLEKEDAK